MLRHKNIDRICCIVLALTLLVTCAYMGAAATGAIAADTAIGYENRLFDQSYVHTIDIVMDDWEAFLDSCTSEEYSACTMVIDGESYGSVAIRGKGNTSLSSVQQYGNDRYSFKVEFDHYQSGASYHGLDKLSLNNLIQDNTYLKDYTAYTLMNRMGVAAPLCSFAQIRVNGEVWGLYLAVEGVEDSFLQRNYGADHGELYKPDSLSFGGGRGNGKGFDMEAMMEQFGFSGEDGETTGSMPQFGNFTMPDMGNMFFGQAGEVSGEDAASGSVPAEGMPDMGGMAPGQAGETSGEDAAQDMQQAAFGGFDPAQMGGFDPSQLPEDFQMPGGMQLPEDFDLSQISENMDFSRGQGGFGGGMGSDDVKLKYIDDDPASYSNIFDNAKTDITEADQARLIESLKALSENDLSVVDQDALLRYLAVHNFLCNGDSYTGTMVHNYYLYEEDGVLAMIPWDYNLAFGGFDGGSDATSAVNAAIDTVVTSGDASDRPMVGWVVESEESLARYHEIYAEFMDSVFNNGWFEAELQRVIDMIAPYVESDPTAFCTYEEFQAGSAALIEFCRLRAESVNAQIDGSIASTSDGQRGSADLVDASGLNISDMGSMGFGGGNGMRGGFDRDSSERGGMQNSRWGGAQSQTGGTASDASAQPQAGGDMPSGMTAADGTNGMPAEGIPESLASGAQPAGRMGDMPSGAFSTISEAAGELPSGRDAQAGAMTPPEGQAAENAPGSNMSGMAGNSQGGMSPEAQPAASEPDAEADGQAAENTPGSNISGMAGNSQGGMSPEAQPAASEPDAEAEGETAAAGQTEASARESRRQSMGGNAFPDAAAMSTGGAQASGESYILLTACVAALIAGLIVAWRMKGRM